MVAHSHVTQGELGVLCHGEEEDVESAHGKDTNKRASHGKQLVMRHASRVQSLVVLLLCTLLFGFLILSSRTSNEEKMDSLKASRSILMSST